MSAYMVVANSARRGSCELFIHVRMLIVRNCAKDVNVSCSSVGYCE